MSTISAGNTLTTGFVQSSDTTGNLVLSATGTIQLLQNTSAVGSVSAPNTFGFKNRIINGGMVIDQRNAGASFTPTTSINYGTCDRWSIDVAQNSKLTAQQNAGAVTPPEGYINYLGITSSSAYSVLSSDFFMVRQAIEGLNIADLAWGTANAKTVTLSFQVYSSLTGTFGGALRNSAGNRSYPFTYSVPVANTWTSISVTIAGDTTGTWLTTSGIGINLDFSMGAGSTYSGTAGAWAGANYVTATGATSVVGTSGATWYVTGVQLETGSQATTFDFRDYGRELILCQRYYYKQVSGGTYTRFALGFASSTTNVYCIFFLPVNMRIAPSSIDVGGSLGLWNGGAILTVYTIGLETVSTTANSVTLSITTAGLTANAGYAVIANNSSTGFVAYNAEL